MLLKMGIMATKRVNVLSSYILTPFGFGTAETLDAIEAEVSCHQRASLITCLGKDYLVSNFLKRHWDVLDAELHDESDCSRLEALLLFAAKHAVFESNINPKSDKTLFVFESFFNCNIPLNEEIKCNKERSIQETANLICRTFDNPNRPLVVNRNTFGVDSFELAINSLYFSEFDNVVLVAADVLSAEDTEFLDYIGDLDCDSMVFGEAAAALVLSKDQPGDFQISIKEKGVEDLSTMDSCLGYGDCADFIFTNINFGNPFCSMVCKRKEGLQTPIKSLYHFLGFTFSATSVILATIGAKILENVYLLEHFDGNCCYSKESKGVTNAREGGIVISSKNNALSYLEVVL